MLVKYAQYGFEVPESIAEVADGEREMSRCVLPKYSGQIFTQK